MKAVEVRGAALDAVCARGPWQVDLGTFGSNVQTLTAEQLRLFYEAVPDVATMTSVVGAGSLSDRRCDRFLQMLKRAKLIEFDKVSRTWIKL